MAKMRAIEAAVQVMLKDGVTAAFGLPGAAINPLYAAMRKIGGIDHVLARHVEGASHMTEGYTRAKAGNIGVCIGTSGPAGTDMITGLYSASADFIPILCITGQAPRVRLYKEDFQAVDIESIANPVTKWAVTVREPAQVPRAFQQAFISCARAVPGRSRRVLAHRGRRLREIATRCRAFPADTRMSGPGWPLPACGRFAARGAMAAPGPIRDCDRCWVHQVLRSSRSFKNTVRWSGFSGKSGKASCNFAITVGLSRRKNVLTCLSTSSVDT